MCAPGAASAGIGIAQAGIGYLGAQGRTANNNRAIRASNRARIDNYNYQIQQQDREWANTLKIWNQRLEQYDKQLERNMDAAYGYGGAYMGLQVQTNEKFREAAFQAQDSFVKLNQVLGTAQATGQTGKTAERFDVASLGAFGREQALRASNLTSAIDKQKLDQTNVRRQLEDANNRAYQSVAVAPVPGMRPLAPQLSSMQSTNAFPFIAQAGQAAFTGLGKSGFFGEGIQNSFLPGIKDPLQVG